MYQPLPQSTRKIFSRGVNNFFEDIKIKDSKNRVYSHKHSVYRNISGGDFDITVPFSEKSIFFSKYTHIGFFVRQYVFEEESINIFRKMFDDKKNITFYTCEIVVGVIDDVSNYIIPRMCTEVYIGDEEPSKNGLQTIRDHFSDLAAHLNLYKFPPPKPTINVTVQGKKSLPKSFYWVDIGGSVHFVEIDGNNKLISFLTNGV